MRGRQRRVAVGEMRVADRLGQLREAPPRAHRVGQQLRHVAHVLLDDVPHEPPQRPLRQPLRRGVHRNEAARVQTIVLAVALDDLEVGLTDGDRALEALHFPVEDEPLSALEDLREIRAPEPRCRCVAGAVAQHDREWHARAPRRRRADAGDHPGRRRRLPRLELAQRREPRAVFVAQRDEEERVADGREPLLAELCGALRTHALDELQRRVQSVRRGWCGLPGRRHCVRSLSCCSPRLSRISRSDHGPAV